MAEPVRYRNKETQFGTGMLRFRTELLNADADAHLWAELIVVWVSPRVTPNLR
jgi:hypothetical protein